MRFGRLLLGLFLVIFSLWVIVGEQISGVSSDAVVNARLSTVRAPSAGTLDMPMRPLGDRFASGEVVAELTAAHQDRQRLDDLELEAALAEADLAYLDRMADMRDRAQTMPRRDLEVASNETGAPLIATEDDREVFADPEMVRAAARLEAIRARLGREWYRIGEEAKIALTAPGEGILWEVLAGDGEYVERGQDMAKFVVCGSALVTLSVPENVYARLTVGQTAKFRLDGTSAVFDGTITRMAGAGAETIYRNLAVAPSIKHLERYDIALLVPELRESADLRCSVGRTGRVFFESRPLDWFRTALR